MQSTNSLFRLIKSLSKNEKGYFKKVAAAFLGDKESTLLQLFDAIDKQEQYDEDELLKKFRRESFVKHFSVAKGKLFDQVLKALRMYHSGNPQMEMDDHFENAQLLFARLLTEDGFTELERAERLAADLGKPGRLFELGTIARRVNYDSAMTNWDEVIKTGIDQERVLLKNLLAEVELNAINYQLQRFIRHHRIIRTAEQDAELDALMTSPHLKVDYNMLSFDGKIRYHMIHKIYYQVKNRDTEALEHMRLVVQEYRNHPKVIAAEPKRFVLALNNYLTICSKQLLLDEIDRVLSWVDVEMLKNDFSAQVFWFDLSGNYGMMQYLHRANMDTHLHVPDKLLQQLVEFEPYMNPVRAMLLRFNCLIFYLNADKPELALDLINQILASKGIDLRKDLFAVARIYNLLIHFELGNMLLLESVARSAKNFLQTRDMYFELEQLIIRHVLQLSNCADKTAQQEVFRKLLKELDALITDNPLEKNLLHLIDIVSWANAHIQDVSLCEYQKMQARIAAS